MLENKSAADPRPVDSEPLTAVTKPRNPSVNRRLFWLAVSTVAIGSGLACLEFRFRRPVGSGPAGPAVAREAFNRVWTTRKVHLFGAGDSITAGLGAKSPSHSFFNRLVQGPGDEFPDMQGVCLSAVLPNLTFENTAVSGSNSLDHLAALQEHLREFPADTLGLVVLTTGGNDLIHWYGTKPPREGAMYGATWEQARPWIDAFAVRLAQMLDLISTRFPGGCHIFLGDIYDPTDGVGDAPSAYLPDWPDGLAIHREYNRVIHQAGSTRPHVHIVPLYATFLGHGIHCRQFYRSTYRPEDPTYWYYGNIEDPNDRGHDAVRRAFLNEIVPIADQLSTSSGDGLLTED